MLVIGCSMLVNETVHDSSPMMNEWVALVGAAYQGRVATSLCHEVAEDRSQERKLLVEIKRIRLSHEVAKLFAQSTSPLRGLKYQFISIQGLASLATLLRSCGANT